MDVGRVRQSTAIHCQFRLVNRVKQHRYALIVQTLELNRRRQRWPSLYSNRVSMPAKHSQAKLNRNPMSNLFADTLVYTIAHWSGPTRTYVDFS